MGQDQVSGGVSDDIEFPIVNLPWLIGDVP